MAIHDFRSQRLFIDQPLEAGIQIEASREQANYLLNVLRLKNDSELLVFNGRDGEWVVRIEATGRKKCHLHVIRKIREQPSPTRIVYCFAPLKQGRLDYMIQKAVEMGAGVLLPIITEFTQVRAVNENRMTANAIEAAEQCGILSIPQILQPTTLTEIRDAIGDCPIVFCDEDAPFANEIDGLPDLVPDAKIALLIGPEGGFSQTEREMLSNDQNTFRLGLGPRILRADTAAVAALAIIQSRIGDWKNSPNG